MAKQRGVHKLEGTIDELTYYQRGGKQFARKRTTLRGDRIKTDPAFSRVQETFQEFGMVARTGKLIRKAFGAPINKISDGRLFLRMNSALHAIKVLDNVNPAGSRTIGQALETPEARAILTGFGLNQNAVLDQIVQAPISVDAVTGIVSVTGLVPDDMLKAPYPATHFSLQSVWTRIDFETGAFKTIITNGAPMLIDATVQDIELTPASVPQGNGRDLIALTVRFYKTVNGIMLPLYDSGHQAGEIISVA
jgi:hypothetical protein